MPHADGKKEELFDYAYFEFVIDINSMLWTLHPPAWSGYESRHCTRSFILYPESATQHNFFVIA